MRINYINTYNQKNNKNKCTQFKAYENPKLSPSEIISMFMAKDSNIEPSDYITNLKEFCSFMEPLNIIVEDAIKKQHLAKQLKNRELYLETLKTTKKIELLWQKIQKISEVPEYLKTTLRDRQQGQTTDVGHSFLAPTMHLRSRLKQYESAKKGEQGLTEDILFDRLFDNKPIFDNKR